MLAFGKLDRRAFLAVCGWGLIGGRLHGAGVATDAALQAGVPNLVRRRESLKDAVTPFRAGGSERIDAVMAQFGEVVASFGGNVPPRILALRWALSQYLLPEASATYSRAQRGQHLPESVTSFAKGDHKCNKLVADAYAVGAGVGLAVGADWFSPGTGTGWPAVQIGTDLWPPKANDLAEPDKNLRSLTDARPLRQPGEDKAAPELGDLIAFPAAQASGHVGLYLGRNLIVSAKETGIEIGPVEAEQAAHGNVVLIRKFNRSGW